VKVWEFNIGVTRHNSSSGLAIHPSVKGTANCRKHESEADAER
jgi:hypothetical protein